MKTATQPIDHFKGVQPKMTLVSNQKAKKGASYMDILNQCNTILNAIKFEREKRGWSQYDFGEKLGISQNAYYKLENGKTKMDLFRLFQIADVLQINLNKLLLF